MQNLPELMHGEISENKAHGYGFKSTRSTPSELELELELGSND